MATQDAIVVAVDGSAASQAAVHWAAATAARRRKPLHLAACWELPVGVPAAHADAMSQAVQAEARDNAAAARKLALQVAADVSLVVDVRQGRPARELLQLSRQAATLVMGARGLGRLGGAILGSVSAAVVSHATCPVVIVRDQAQAETARGPVVVGIDGSRVSRYAAEVAFQEADARGVGVVAVASWLDRSIYASPAALEAARRHAAALEQQQQAMLAGDVRSLARRYPDIPLQQVVSQGEPADALASAAADAQLLVVGSHGRGAFLDTILGSTSRALLQKSPCPLMVVRPAGG